MGIRNARSIEFLSQYSQPTVLILSEPEPTSILSLSGPPYADILADHVTQYETLSSAMHYQSTSSSVRRRPFGASPTSHPIAARLSPCLPPDVTIAFLFNVDSFSRPLFSRHSHASDGAVILSSDAVLYVNDGRLLMKATNCVLSKDDAPATEIILDSASAAFFSSSDAIVTNADGDVLHLKLDYDVDGRTVRSISFAKISGTCAASNVS